MRILVPLLLAGCFVSSPPATCEPPGTQVSTPRAAGCLTVDSDKLLLVKTSGGWGIPGGYVVDGETSKAAAKRETQEETGLTVFAGPPICAVQSKGFVAHACATRETLPQPTADSPEVVEARWASADEIHNMPASEWRFPAQVEMYLTVLRGAAAARQRLESGEQPPPPE